MRQAQRFLALAAVLLAAAGCGDTGLTGASITGGSVPIGPTRVAGEAALATSPDEPVVGAEVSVTDSSGTTRTATTDTAGEFSVAGAAAGPAAVHVSAPGMRPLDLNVNIPPNGTAQLALALVPSDVQEPDVQSLTADHQGIQAKVGDIVRIRATQKFGLGPGGMPSQEMSPSWVVEGGVGEIRHGGPGDALFVATQAGTGRILITSGARQIIIPVTVTQ